MAAQTLSGTQEAIDPVEQFIALTKALTEMQTQQDQQRKLISEQSQSNQLQQMLQQQMTGQAQDTAVKDANAGTVIDNTDSVKGFFKGLGESLQPFQERNGMTETTPFFDVLRAAAGAYGQNQGQVFDQQIKQRQAQDELKQNNLKLSQDLMMELMKMQQKNAPKVSTTYTDAKGSQVYETPAGIVDNKGNLLDLSTLKKIGESDLKDVPSKKYFSPTTDRLYEARSTTKGLIDIQTGLKLPNDAVEWVRPTGEISPAEERRQRTALLTSWEKLKQEDTFKESLQTLKQAKQLNKVIGSGSTFTQPSVIPMLIRMSGDKFVNVRDVSQFVGAQNFAKNIDIYIQNLQQGKKINDPQFESEFKKLTNAYLEASKTFLLEQIDRKYNDLVLTFPEKAATILEYKNNTLKSLGLLDKTPTFGMPTKLDNLEKKLGRKLNNDEKKDAESRGLI